MLSQQLGNDLDRGLDDVVGRFLELFSRELSEEVALENLGRRFLGEEGRLARLRKGLHWASVEKGQTSDQTRAVQEGLEECIELFRSEGVAEIVGRLAAEGDGRAMHASLNPRAEFGIDLGGRSEKNAWIFPTVPGGLPPY